MAKRVFESLSARHKFFASPPQKQLPESDVPCRHCNATGRVPQPARLNPLWLRWVRLRYNVSYGHMAQWAGVTRNMLSLVENGHAKCPDYLQAKYEWLDEHGAEYPGGENPVVALLSTQTEND